MARTIPLLGIMGQKQAGKDTFAALLRDTQGYERWALADPLRAALLRTDPFIGRGTLRVSDAVCAHGWDGAKRQHPEVRRLLQDFGVSIRALDEDFWCRRVVPKAATLARMGYPQVITDVRFPNEVAAVRKAGGSLVRIIRPGLPDDDRHESENAWRDTVPDFTVTNDKTTDDLRKIAEFVGGMLLYGR